MTTHASSGDAFPQDLSANAFQAPNAVVHHTRPQHLQLEEVAQNLDQVLYVFNCASQKVEFVNAAYERIWGRSQDSIHADADSFLNAIHEEDRHRFIDAIAGQTAGQQSGERREFDYRVIRPDGSIRYIRDRGIPTYDEHGQAIRVTGIAEDITHYKEQEMALVEQSRLLERVLEVGQVVAAELDLERIVQTVTDASCELSGAQYGAFFYNVIGKEGESYTLYTLSGVPREAFAKFPMPRATALFGPTFRGEGTIRIDDVRQDARFGKNAPYQGLPAGHLPVVSYLAVPVISRAGEVLGGLFFAHEQAGVFTVARARIVEQLAAQAAVAIDNARLFEQVERERAVARSSEQNYLFLAEAIPQIVWVVEPNGVASFVNQRWWDYVGMEPSGADAKTWAYYIHPDDLPEFQQSWPQALAGNVPFEMEYRVRRASDGTYRWHLLRAVPFCDEQGQVLKWFGTSTDIDDQKEAQEALQFLSNAGTVLSTSLEYQETVNRLAALAVPRLCDWCVVDVEEEGKIKRVAAVHQDPLKVQLAYDYLEQYPPHPEDPNGVYSVLRSGRSQLTPEISDELLETGTHDPEMLALLRKLGLCSAMMVPLQARGQTIGVMTLISAESGRHFNPDDLVLAEEFARRAAEAVHNARLYQEAQRALQHAENATRSRDEFLAIVSHELRTPLTPIIGWTSLLQSKPQMFSTPESMQQALGTIERNARAQSQLVNDLLDVSRIVTGKLNLEVRSMELHTVVEAALETVRPAADAKGIKLRPFLDSNAGVIKGDPDRLQQVVWNLLTNAIKFTPRGGRVEVLLERGDSTVELIVRDNGQGIEPDFLPRVFDRFLQADNTATRHHGGLGLGLSIVRHLVDMHGGRIIAESAGAGLGATFRVCLPVLAVVDETSSTGQPPVDDIEFIHELTSQTSRTLLEGIRVLVVEDEADARELIEAVLRGYGAQVQIAPSAEEGLQKLQEWLPDLLVSDIGMPHEDGYALLRKVRTLPGEQGGKTPAIALTAYARMEDRFKALASGFQNHVTKPVEPAELAITIASLLGRPII